MFKQIVLMSCFLFSSTLLAAEAPQIEWTRTFGGVSYDWAYWVEETRDSGFIVAGYTFTEPNGEGEEDMYVVKTDRYGNVEWENTYGDSLMDKVTCIRQLDDGGYILCGSSLSYPPGGTDIRVLRLDSLGDTAWAREYGGEFTADNAQGICQTLDGNFIIAGNNSSEGIYILKIDGSGDIIHEEFFDITGDAHAVEPTHDSGAIMIAGSTNLILLKIDASGVRTWSRAYGSGAFGTSVIQLPDSGYAALGYKEFSPLNDQFWLLRMDKNGDTVWRKNYGEAYDDNGHCVRRTFDGGFIMTGDMYPGVSSARQIYVIRTDSAGNVLWTKEIGGPEWEYSLCIQQTTDSGYVVAGRTDSYGNGDFDFYLIKLAKDPVYITAVNENDDLALPGYRLEQNYPNPFNPSTVIEFDLARRSHVSITIYNLLGQKIAELADRQYPPGSHRVIWDGTTMNGGRAATGIYFYRLRTDNFVETKKMILLK
jgi:hypothetical protein